MHTEPSERKQPKNFERHYQAIRDEAERVGWPTTFRTDLTKHDRAWLANRDPSKPFVWILREGGTHICAPGIIDGVFHKASQYGRMVSEAFRPHPCRFYLWDGVGLTEFATPEALDVRTAEIEAELGLTGYRTREISHDQNA